MKGLVSVLVVVRTKVGTVVCGLKASSLEHSTKLIRVTNLVLVRKASLNVTNETKPSKKGSPKGYIVSQNLVLVQKGKIGYL